LSLYCQGVIEIKAVNVSHAPRNMSSAVTSESNLYEVACEESKLRLSVPHAADQLTNKVLCENWTEKLLFFFLLFIKTALFISVRT
jgi:hypothetical protein